MEINHGNMQTLGVAFNAAFKTSLVATETFWKTVAMEVASTTSSQEYGWLGNIPSMREWTGDRVLNALKSHDYRIKNRRFEQSVEVDLDDVSDDNVGIYTPMFQGMGEAAAQHDDKLVWDLVKAGGSTKCYDGQNFFDTDHPVIDENGAEQSVSNDMGGAGAHWYLVDDSRPVSPMILQRRENNTWTQLDRPTDKNVFDRNAAQYGVKARKAVGYGLWQLMLRSGQELNAANLQAARTAMTSMKGDHGLQLAIKPRKLVVPPQHYFKALELIQAERNAAGATNTMRGLMEVVEVPYLS